MHVTVQHCHEADVSSVEALKVKVKMRSTVRDIRARPGQVLAAAVSSASDEVRAKIGRPDSLRRTLRRLGRHEFSI